MAIQPQRLACKASARNWLLQGCIQPARSIFCVVICLLNILFWTVQSWLGKPSQLAFGRIKPRASTPASRCQPM